MVDLNESQKLVQDMRSPLNLCRVNLGSFDWFNGLVAVTGCAIAGVTAVPEGPLMAS